MTLGYGDGLLIKPEKKEMEDPVDKDYWKQPYLKDLEIPFFCAHAKTTFFIKVRIFLVIATNFRIWSFLFHSQPIMTKIWWSRKELWNASHREMCVSRPSGLSPPILRKGRT